MLDGKWRYHESPGWAQSNPQGYCGASSPWLHGIGILISPSDLWFNVLTDVGMHGFSVSLRQLQRLAQVRHLVESNCMFRGFSVQCMSCPYLDGPHVVGFAAYPIFSSLNKVVTALQPSPMVCGD